MDWFFISSFIWLGSRFEYFFTWLYLSPSWLLVIPLAELNMESDKVIWTVYCGIMLINLQFTIVIKCNIQYHTGSINYFCISNMVAVFKQSSFGQTNIQSCPKLTLLVKSVLKRASATGFKWKTQLSWSVNTLHVLLMILLMNNYNVYLLIEHLKIVKDIHFKIRVLV